MGIVFFFWVFAAHTVINYLAWLIHESSSSVLHPDRATASGFVFLPLRNDLWLQHFCKINTWL